MAQVWSCGSLLSILFFSAAERLDHEYGNANDLQFGDIPQETANHTQEGAQATETTHSHVQKSSGVAYPFVVIHFLSFFLQKTAC